MKLMAIKMKGEHFNKGMKNKLGHTICAFKYLIDQIISYYTLFRTLGMQLFTGTRGDVL